MPDDRLTRAESCPAPSAVWARPAVPEGHAAPTLPPIAVVGCGLRGASLPPGHAAVVDGAQVLAGGARLLEAFAGHPGERIVIASPLDDTLDAVARCRERGLRVAVLADGDPLFFGIGARLAARFGPEGLRVLPAVGCLQEAAARIALPWQDAQCVSLHGRDDHRPLTAALRAGGPVCVLTDGRNTPATIAHFLLDRGVCGLRLHAFADMGATGERHATFDLPAHNDSAPAASANSAHLPEGLADLGGNCVVLLVRDTERSAGPCALPALGIPDAHFAVEAGLLTKWPVRAAGLAALRIAPHDTVWDLGAGSGAVSIEAAALARNGLVVAVERHARRVALIAENRRRFGAPNVQIVHDELPGCLHRLPDPDRVFIGGGLGGPATPPDGAPCDAPSAGPLLDAVCARLAPGGRLVAHCVLLGSLERVRAALLRRGWPAEITCIQASEAQPLCGDLRLAAMNPVFIVSATRPEPA